MQQKLHNAKKLISSILALVFMLAFTVATVPQVKADDTTKLIVHYYRFDKNYTGWNVWAWEYAPAPGSCTQQDGYQFTKDEADGWKTCEVDLPGKVTKTGFLLRKGNWDKKEACSSADIIEDTSKGTTEVWIIQDDAKVYDTKPTPKLKMEAFQDDKNVITLNLGIKTKLTGKDNEGIQVLANGTDELPIESVTDANATPDATGTSLVKITLKDNLDLTTSYQVARAGANNAMVMPRNVLDSDDYYYSKDDLGATYTKGYTWFKLWAPTSPAVSLYLYKGLKGEKQEIEMQQGSKGVWYTKVKGDLNGYYYQYHLMVQNYDEEGVKEYTVADPYSKGASANSEKSLIFDLAAVDAKVAGWDADKEVTLKNNTDAVIYETQVKEFTADKSSGAKNAGKYLGLVEEGTKNADGLSTGIDHLKELGVTHVHLNPTYDFGSGDETKSDWFNWGYDPVLLQTPEGSYSTNPNDTSRQVEYKEMVEGLHKNNLGVVFDAVFNHTLDTKDASKSIFDKIVPGYYYRVDNSGVYESQSGCGNVIASEKPMVKKYLVDTVKYWFKEYHLDGMRFDYLGLMDIDAMNQMYKAAKEINPSALFYGEGWSMDSNRKDSLMTQANVKNTGIAAYNDGIRDDLRGGNYTTKVSKGFVQGGDPLNGLDNLKLEIKGQSTANNPDKVDVATPNETLNYVACHDNLTLRDRIVASIFSDDAKELKKADTDTAALKAALKNASGDVMTKAKKLINLTQVALFTSQGIPELYAGDEFGRSKADTDDPNNSYKSATGNEIDWSLETTNKDLNAYIEGLIKLRKAHSAFRMTSKTDVDNAIEFAKVTPYKTIEYVIKNSANGDSWKNILVILNASDKERKMKVTGNWNIVVNDQKAGTDTITTAKDEVTVAPNSAVVAYTNGDYKLDDNQPDPTELPKKAADTAPVTKVVKVGDYTLNVLVPAATAKDDMYMVGSFQKWNEKSGAKLELQKDGTYLVNATINPTDEWKFVRGTSWDNGEKTAAGEEIANRTLGDQKVQTLSVEKWADKDDTSYEVKKVKVGDYTLNVILPASTGKDDIYMVGSFQKWDEKNGAKLVAQKDGSYVVDATIKPTDEWKFVRGTTWDNGEKTATGDEISNRTLGDQKVQTLVVGKWADKDGTTGLVKNVKVGDYTLQVIMPATTGKDDVYMVGSFQKWDEKNGAKLELQKDGSYVVNATIKSTDEWKFVRGTTWDNGEKTATGDEISNRTLGDQKVQTLLVGKWADK